MAGDKDAERGTETQRFGDEAAKEKAITIMLGNGWRVQSQQQQSDGRYEVVFELNDRPGPV